MNNTISRTFGQYQIDVTDGRISLVGHTNSNYGHFYPHNFERFNRHPKGAEYDWNRPQILGMAWEYGLTGSVTKWLYSLVEKGRV